MVSNAEPQRRYRQRRALAAGSHADTRRERDAALHRERQNRHRARLVLEQRTHTLAASQTTPPSLPPLPQRSDLTTLSGHPSIFNLMPCASHLARFGTFDSGIQGGISARNIHLGCCPYSTVDG
jgi:hypothetical protein